MTRTENLEVKEKLAKLMEEARDKKVPIESKEIEAVRGWYNSTSEGRSKPISMDELENIMYEIADEFSSKRKKKAPK